MAETALSSRLRSLVHYLAAAAVMAVVTGALMPFRGWLGERPATAAFIQMLVMLLVSALWGVGPALAAMTLGIALFAFAFLPSADVLFMDHPEEAVLLSAYVVASLAVGRIAAEAKRRAAEAQTAHRESSNLNAELREAQAKLRLAADIVRLAYWEWDAASGALRCSPEWARQMGYTKDGAPASCEAWQALLHPEDRAGVVEVLEDLANLGEFEREIDYRQRHHAGKYRWIHARMRALIDERGLRYRIVGTHLDITEQKTAEQEMLQVAQQDALTGLANRKLLLESATRILASAQRLERRVGVLFLDLDGFKPINDSHGHEIGDRLLKAVAERIARAVRAEDLVGRLGGDEFVAVLAEIEEIEDVAHVAEHIVRSLNRPFAIDGLDIQVSASMGISLFPDDGETVDLLIQNADFAMYQAKESGGGRYRYFKPGMATGHAADETAATPNRLRAALEAGEFYLVWQPVCDTGTGHAVEAEALLRWRQPDGRYASPDTFLPVAESSGLIKPLGEWLLHAACEQQRRWAGAGLPDIAVAVKVSPVQFRQKGFAHKVAAAIHAAGIAPALLVLELPERALMGNEDEARHIVEVLKELGIGVAVDNFGAGYSSMRQITQLPVDTLKIDRSFLHPPAGNHASIAAVDAVLALGQSLHKGIVVKGVETEADMALVRGHGCHYAQGFHLGRPMPGAEFTAWRQRTTLAAGGRAAG